MTRHEERSVDAPSPFCEVKTQLAHDFVWAVREFIALQAQQAEAVIVGEPDFTRFDDLLHLARERKDNAKYLLIAHIEDHGCA